MTNRAFKLRHKPYSEVKRTRMIHRRDINARYRRIRLAEKLKTCQSDLEAMWQDVGGI